MSELGEGNELRRTRISVGLTLTGIICVGGVILGSLDRFVGDKFQADDERPPEPLPPAVAPISPGGLQTTVPQKPPASSANPPQGGARMTLSEAQRSIESGMGEAGIPVLQTDGSGFNNPPNLPALRIFLNERAATYSQLQGVAPELGAAAVYCSTFTTLTRIGNQPYKVTIDHATQAFAAGDPASAGSPCLEAIEQTWQPGILYKNMPAAGE